MSLLSPPLPTKPSVERNSRVSPHVIDPASGIVEIGACGLPVQPLDQVTITTWKAEFPVDGPGMAASDDDDDTSTDPTPEENDDDEFDDFDDIDEDDFDDDFDDDFEEELDDDYEIEIEDEISAEFGLSGVDAVEIEDIDDVNEIAADVDDPVNDDTAKD